MQCHAKTISLQTVHSYIIVHYGNTTCPDEIAKLEWHILNIYISNKCEHIINY